VFPDRLRLQKRVVNAHHAQVAAREAIYTPAFAINLALERKVMDPVVGQPHNLNRGPGLEIRKRPRQAKRDQHLAIAAPRVQHQVHVPSAVRERVFELNSLSTPLDPAERHVTERRVDAPVTLEQPVHHHAQILRRTIIEADRPQEASLDEMEFAMKCILNERSVASALAGIMLVVLAPIAGCQNTPRPTETIRRSGDWHFQHGDYAAAAAAYQEIVDRTPGDWQAQYRLGLSLIEIDRPGDARESLEVANNLKPNDPAIRDALARAMYEQGASTELFAYLRSRANETRATRDYLQMARYAMLEEDYDLAELALRTAIEVDAGRSVEPHLEMAALQSQLGRNATAGMHLRAAQEIDPADPRVREALRRSSVQTTQADGE